MATEESDARPARNDIGQMQRSKRRRVLYR